jgi:hypothetical protein
VGWGVAVASRRHSRAGFGGNLGFPGEFWCQELLGSGLWAAAS